MSKLLQEIASLPQIHGGLVVQPVTHERVDGFCLLRTDTNPAVAVAAVHDGSDRGRAEAEGYARVPSGTPAILGLLAALLVRWSDDAADDDEINSGDAVAWLRHIAEVREFSTFLEVADVTSSTDARRLASQK